jgi:large subunit ribosomal protein L25
MTEHRTLVVEVRDERGSGEARRLRRAGWLPGVINSPEGESLPVRINAHAFGILLQHHQSESMMVDVDVKDRGVRKLLLREVQHDPLSGEPLHADFLEVSMTKTMRIELPVELVGHAQGVNEGGVLEHLLHTIEVECLPGDLPESINVDVSGMNLNDRIMVSDIEVPDKLTIVTPPDVAVASVALPRIVEAEAEAEEAAAEGEAEPEVIGEKKAEAEGEEES